MKFSECSPEIIVLSSSLPHSGQSFIVSLVRITDHSRLIVIVRVFTIWHYKTRPLTENVASIT